MIVLVDAQQQSLLKELEPGDRYQRGEALGDTTPASQCHWLKTQPHSTC
jgi:hypothetical protein